MTASQQLPASKRAGFGVRRYSAVELLAVGGRRQTLVTLSTVGGTFYITVLIARLVTMYSPSRTESTNSSTQP